MSLIILEGHSKTRLAVLPSAVKVITETTRVEIIDPKDFSKREEIKYCYIYVDDNTDDSGFLVKGSLEQVAGLLGLQLIINHPQ